MVLLYVLVIEIIKWSDEAFCDVTWFDVGGVAWRAVGWRCVVKRRVVW